MHLKIDVPILITLRTEFFITHLRIPLSFHAIYWPDFAYHLFFFVYFGSYYIHSVCNENTRLFFTHPPGGNFIDFEFYFRKTNFLVDFIHCKMLNLVYIYECNFHMKLNIETVFNSICYNLNQFQRAPSIRINASHSKFESHWYWNLKLDCVKVQYQHHSISNDSNHFELISIEFDSIFFFYTNQTQWAFYWFKQVYFFLLCNEHIKLMIEILKVFNWKGELAHKLVPIELR